MQSTTDGLVTFLPTGLPFICQTAGVAGTVVIQSPIPSGIATIKLDEQTNALPAVQPVSGPITNVSQLELATASNAASETTAEDSEMSEANVDVEKQLIYKHPLFPLMMQLFERCEKATHGGPGSASLSETFDEDILSFVRKHEQDGLPFFIDNPDVDGLVSIKPNQFFEVGAVCGPIGALESWLRTAVFNTSEMVRAIQVLRIHVLEIEKVGELCKDFCQRYIASLKLKLNSEHLLGDIVEFTGLGDDCGPTAVDIQQQQRQQVAALSQGQVVSGGTVYQMVQTPHGLVAQPIQIQQPLLQTVGGASIISNNRRAVPGISRIVSPGGLIGNSLPNYDDDNDSEESSQKKLKRGVLPKRATQIMKSWLFQHIAHPYPTEDEKRQIAAQTNLSMLQVNNWFINGRRRILQPMLDTSGASVSADPKPKVNKGTSSSTKSAQRFWPENLASLQKNPSSMQHDANDSDSQSARVSDEDSEDAESCNYSGDDSEALNLHQQDESLMVSSSLKNESERNLSPSSRQQDHVD